MLRSLVGSEMCIRDRAYRAHHRGWALSGIRYQIRLGRCDHARGLGGVWSPAAQGGRERRMEWKAYFSYRAGAVFFSRNLFFFSSGSREKKPFGNGRDSAAWKCSAGLKLTKRGGVTIIRCMDVFILVAHVYHSKNNSRIASSHSHLLLLYNSYILCYVTILSCVGIT